LIVVAGIIYKFFQYKKKMEVIHELIALKDKNKLTADDKVFIRINKIDYEIQLQKDNALIKFAYPFFILLIGILMVTFSMTEALIHINIVVVTFIYLYVGKIHTQNFIKLLKTLQM
jgi:LEA14-like dessication related protein